jgi:chromosome segregation ATPase
MDIQSSTAPLLRQLESMERQNRARAANWAELESRLRSELEESVIQNESLTKERSDFKAKYTRFERMVKERDDDLAAAKKIIEEQSTKISKLESELEKLAEEGEKRQQEYEKVERLASEGVARVRSEMSQTVMESEERYRGQIHKLETELKTEHEKRTQLEKQVGELLDNAGMIVAGSQAPDTFRRESKPKKLRRAEGQAEILAGALGLDDSDDETDDDDDYGIERTGSGDSGAGGANKRDSTNAVTSFAALDQLTSRLKTAQIELESLRKSLRESEKTRESLVEELGESRAAKEKLPLFEAKVQELTKENREMELEIMGLREDIAEVKEMYRAQLNVLLEEKVGNVGQAQLEDEKPVDGNGSREDPADDAIDFAQESITVDS